jgi:hypothetical protein
VIERNGCQPNQDPVHLELTGDNLKPVTGNDEQPGQESTLVLVAVQPCHGLGKHLGQLDPLPRQPYHHGCKGSEIECMCIR